MLLLHFTFLTSWIYNSKIFFIWMPSKLDHHISLLSLSPVNLVFSPLLSYLVMRPIAQHWWFKGGETEHPESEERLPERKSGWKVFSAPGNPHNTQHQYSVQNNYEKLQIVLIYLFLVVDCRQQMFMEDWFMSFETHNTLIKVKSLL